MDKRPAINLALSLLASGVLSIDAAGFVWRHKSATGGHLRDIPPRRAENMGGKGYLRLSLQGPEGKLVQVMAHRFVWESLNGPIPDGMQINHKDLNRTNNAPANLEVVTPAGNIQHSYAAGRKHPWTDAAEWRPGKARLTPETIAAVRARRAAGVGLKALGIEFGISTTHAQRLCAAP